MCIVFLPDPKLLLLIFSVSRSKVHCTQWAFKNICWTIVLINKYQIYRIHIHFLIKTLFPCLCWTLITNYGSHSEKAIATHSSTLACKIPWMEKTGRLQSMGSRRVGHLLSDFTFHFHALEKEIATHSSILAWRIPGTVAPGGLPSVGSHRVVHDWSDLAAAAAAAALT